MTIAFWIAWCIAGWGVNWNHNQNMKMLNEINHRLDQLLNDKEKK